MPDKKGNLTTENIVEMESDVVTRFVEVQKCLKQAEAAAQSLRPELEKTGVKAVFEHNSENPTTPIQSVNLVSKGDDTSKVMFSWTKKTLGIKDAKMVQELFSRIRTKDGKRVNINDHVFFDVDASFDTGVFFVDGKFSEKRYNVFMQAIGEVAEKLEVPNPLSCGKVLRVRPDFHEERWEKFDAAVNLEIQAVLPTSSRLAVVEPTK